MPVELEVPVGICGKPVVVATVKDNRGVRPDAVLGKERRKGLRGDEVAAHRVLQVLLPVDPHGTGDMAGVVGRYVLIDLDEDDGRICGVGKDPIGIDENICS